MITIITIEDVEGFRTYAAKQWPQFPLEEPKQRGNT